jgi:hypothetical protein
MYVVVNKKIAMSIVGNKKINYEREAKLLKFVWNRKRMFWANSFLAHLAGNSRRLFCGQNLQIIPFPKQRFETG